MQDVTTARVGVKNMEWIDREESRRKTKLMTLKDLLTTNIVYLAYPFVY